MIALVLVPFSLQALVILCDEFFFHRARGLPLWERVGHPIDTLFQLSCLAVPLLADLNRSTFILFSSLAVISTLLITKDERVHAIHCSWKEHWLHSVLFIVHPIVLIATAYLWASPNEHFYFYPLLKLQFLLVACFGIYQVAYWETYAARTRSQ